MAPRPVAPQGVEARATLLERPRPEGFGESAAVAIEDGPLAGRRLLARALGNIAWPEGVAQGAVLEVAGGVRPPRAGSSGGFDERAFMRSARVSGELTLRRVSATGERRGGVAGALDAARGRAATALSAGLDPASAALIRGMVLGDDEAISAPVRDDFRRSGLAHLLAVSGQNVMLLALLALPLLAAAGFGRRARLATLLALIAAYVPLAGAAPSLQRAGVMGAAGVVAMAAGRARSRAHALLLAAAATLALDPLVLHDPGWQLSFAAVCGIMALGPRLRRVFGLLPEPLGEGAAVTCAATVATAPLLAYHFGAVSLVSLPANLAALPAVAPAMWLGMLEIALGQAAGLGPAAEGVVAAVSSLLGRLNAVPLAYLQWVARAFADLPWAQTEVALSWPATAASFVGIGAVAVGAVRAARRLESRGTALVGRWRLASRATRLSAIVAAAAAGALLVWPLVGSPPPPRELTVRFLDVGQGDATLVQDPSAGAVLFDGGPEDARVARLLRAAGVRRLALVVATHASADHHGGLAEVLRRFPVDLLLENGDGTADPGFRALLEEARRRGVRTATARAGEVLRAGNLEIRLLWPPPRRPGPAPEDPNPRAVVAVVSSGSFDLMLSADAESPTLAALPLPDVEAMKVPHHGSADPGLPEVLDRLRPQVAAVQVGENSYGHPTASTLAALRAAGARVYRTDEQGTITLTVGGAGMRVETER